MGWDGRSEQNRRESGVGLGAKWEVCVNPCDAAVLLQRALLLDIIRGGGYK